MEVLTACLISALALSFLIMKAAPFDQFYARGFNRDPVRLSPNLAWKTAKSTPAESSLPSKAVVLVVDDDEDICSITELLLKKNGLKVYSALDGRTGVERFCEHADEINVVLMDMTMPGMSGVEAGRLILNRKPDVRIIMSSGYSDQTASEQIECREGLDFLQKPYSIETLLAKIEAAVQHA